MEFKSVGFFFFKELPEGDGRETDRRGRGRERGGWRETDRQTNRQHKHLQKRRL